MRPLTTAQTVAQLAVTLNEFEYAQDALRLGDHSVDLNFSAALRAATENPAPANLIKPTRWPNASAKASAVVKADQGRRRTVLTQQLAKSAP